MKKRKSKKPDDLGEWVFNVLKAAETLCDGKLRTIYETKNKNSPSYTKISLRIIKVKKGGERNETKSLVDNKSPFKS